MSSKAASPKSKGGKAKQKLKIPHEVYYDTSNDSCMHNLARWMMCNCMGQKSRISTENVKIRFWSGCSHTELSMDVDNIKDIQLRESCGPCLCLCGRGDIRIYGQDADQKDEFFDVKNVENAGEVFLKLTELIHKINDLKFGMSRPDDKKLEHMLYNSKTDPCKVKCIRTCLFGCLRPTTLVTKTAITQSKWTIGKRVTKRLDLDNVEDLQVSKPCLGMCCGFGTIRVYGKDEDQKDDFFDITYVSNVKERFVKLDNFWNLLNNRNRIGFETGHGGGDGGGMEGVME